MIRQMQESYDLGEENCYKDEVMLTVVVVGASGDLARKKIFPALFALYYQGLLPPHLQIVGYARSDISNEDFREKIYSTLGCRIDAKYGPHLSCQFAHMHSTSDHLFPHTHDIQTLESDAGAFGPRLQCVRLKPIGIAL